MVKDYTIDFIITGGTIDSYYEVTTETTMPNKRSAIPDFIRILRLYEKCRFTTVCMKDSRNLTLSDRRKILAAVKKSISGKIIITHGTYTLPTTAKYIEANLEKTNKTIVFVCSMIPLAGFIPTDAGFNIGYAIAKLQDLPAGIYVCMNGRIFAPEEVFKNIAEGRFGSIYTR